jgi:hypothetical protein
MISASYDSLARTPPGAHNCRDALLDRAEVPALISATVPAVWDATPHGRATCLGEVGCGRLSRVTTERDEVRSYDATSGLRSRATMASGRKVVAVTIDITFDFRTDATGMNPDPDASSPTLLRYHHLLWSKPLPSGKQFELAPRSQKPYALLHDSELGKFLLTSDSVLATFTRRPDMQAIIGQLPPADIVALNTITYTIGGMVLWPGNQIDGKWAINQARGCTGSIADRFDLTVECVRRHYQGDTTHPLADSFGRYRDFFDLFGSFAGYVDFWLLDDRGCRRRREVLPALGGLLPAVGPSEPRRLPRLLRAHHRVRHGSERAHSPARTLTERRQ